MSSAFGSFGRGRGRKLPEKTIEMKTDFNTVKDLFPPVYKTTFGSNQDKKDEKPKVENGESELQRELPGSEESTKEDGFESENSVKENPIKSILGLETTSTMNSQKPEGKGRNFWTENKKFELPPIPHESNKVLEEIDVKFYADEFLGHNECDVRDEDVGVKPVLPRRCYLKDDRYFLGMVGKLQLPVDLKMSTRLLCVDSQDLLFLRFEEGRGQIEGQVQTLQSLLLDMKIFYSQFANQIKYCVGQGRWFPVPGEVVVVKVTRLHGSELLRNGCSGEVVYQRALVRGISEDGITVELLDDYGLGGVLHTNVYRIVERFTTLPAQMFVCELAEMGLFNTQSMVQKILKESPITQIWPDCLMVHVETTWFGEVSKKNRPLVEILIQSNSSKFLSLKSYVYRNISAFQTSLVHLTKPYTRCRVMGANDGGYLWINFPAQDQLAGGIRFVLERLIPHYHHFSEYLQLTVDMILPKDDEERLKINMNKTYAVLLPDLNKSADFDIKCLYRVTINKVDRKTNRVKVYCIDHFAIREAYSWELVPMNILYPELSYFAPLVSKVHLHSIKELNISHVEVKQLLYGEELKVQLVREWPRNVFPPEVCIDAPGSTELDEMNNDERKTNLLKGYNRVFVENKWAKKMDEKEMAAFSNLIIARAIHVEDTIRHNLEEEKTFKTSKDRPREEQKKLLAAYTFLGAYYRFDWDSQFNVASSATSVYTSACSTGSAYN